MEKELKTLKDLEISSDPVIIKNGVLVSGGTGKIEVRDLKQEAIKHIKERKHRKSILFEGEELEGKIIDGQIDWIKYFFNITEEDLK